MATPTAAPTKELDSPLAPYALTKYLHINVPKMLVDIKLANSRTEAERLVKAGAVEIDGYRITSMWVTRGLFDNGGCAWYWGKLEI